MKQTSHTIQGMNINVTCDQRLYSRISNYLGFFYPGEPRPYIRPLSYDISIRKTPPPIPGNAVKTLRAGELTSYSSDTDSYYTLKNGSIIYFNSILGRAEGFIRKETLNDPERLFSLIGAPISENLKYNSLYSFHSAALFSKGVGYLFSGDSGSGKTSSTLSLISAGYKYVSDDVVLLEEVNGVIIANSLAKTLNIDRDMAGRFPYLLKDETYPAEAGTKMSFDITKSFPDSFIPHLRPDVIIFVKKNLNGTSRALPLSQTEVFKRLLKQTVLATNKEVSRNQLKAYGMLVRQVRGFELLNGRDIYENPETLVHIMNRMGCHNADH